MRATLKLDPIKHRIIFSSPDLTLRFSVSNLLTSIDEILEIDTGYISFMCNATEECIDLNDVMEHLNMKWDFSKYELEVLPSWK